MMHIYNTSWYIMIIRVHFALLFKYLCSSHQWSFVTIWIWIKSHLPPCTDRWQSGAEVALHCMETGLPLPVDVTVEFVPVCLSHSLSLSPPQSNDCLFYFALIANHRSWNLEITLFLDRIEIGKFITIIKNVTCTYKIYCLVFLLNWMWFFLNLPTFNDFCGLKSALFLVSFSHMNFLCSGMSRYSF